MKNFQKNLFMCLIMILGYTTIQASLGGSSNTYAPQIFKPAQAFNKKGMVGNYFASNSTATIHNPSLTEENGYTFTQVVDHGITAPQGKILIGSYLKHPNKAKLGKPQHGGVAVINLYGVQQQ